MAPRNSELNQKPKWGFSCWQIDIFLGTMLPGVGGWCLLVLTSCLLVFILIYYLVESVPRASYWLWPFSYHTFSYSLYSISFWSSMNRREKVNSGGILVAYLCSMYSTQSDGTYSNRHESWWDQITSVAVSFFFLTPGTTWSIAHIMNEDRRRRDLTLVGTERGKQRMLLTTG